MPRLHPILLISSLAFLIGVAPFSCGPLAKFGAPEFECVSTKQNAAGGYSQAAFRSWAKWAEHQDDARRDEELMRAGEKLAQIFGRAELKSRFMGVDCVEQTGTSSS
jgi:hypothetical protein